ncbi:YetF domain-containing protein [Actinoplanes sp. NPDC048967]|uniref:DUF421 domain-containing protein n=1 Tax=Actinoplanes sp. NPDC048967 TaxID=3155269 RepID=UPI0033C6EF81
MPLRRDPDGALSVISGEPLGRSHLAAVIVALYSVTVFAALAGSFGAYFPAPQRPVTPPVGYRRTMFFDKLADLGRIGLIGVLTYVLLIAVLRVSGKRTLAKMNAFDLVVTVALGSTLATILLSTDVSFTEGAAALILLIALQFAATWLSVRWSPLREALKSAPTLLLRDGELLIDAMRRQRVTDNEIFQAVRSQGIGDLATVAAVVLETDGTFSVIPAQQAGGRTALRDVDAAHPRGASTPDSA